MILAHNIYKLKYKKPYQRILRAYLLSLFHYLYIKNHVYLFIVITMFSNFTYMNNCLHLYNICNSAKHILFFSQFLHNMSHLKSIRNHIISCKDSKKITIYTNDKRRKTQCNTPSTNTDNHGFGKTTIYRIYILQSNHQ